MYDTVGFVRHYTNMGVPVPITGMVSVSTGTVWKIPTHEKPYASDKMNLVSQSHDIFAAPHVPLPEFLTGTAVSIQPPKGVIDTDPARHIPPSISIELPISQGAILRPVADVTTLPVPQVPGTLAGADVHNSVPDM